MNLRCLFGHAWRAISVYHWCNNALNKEGHVINNMAGTNVTYRCTRCDALRTEELAEAGHISLSAFLPNAIDVGTVTEAALRKMKEKP